MIYGKEYRLGDLLDIIHGYTFKSEYFSETPTHWILITPANFKIGGGFNKTRLKYYNGPISEKFILSSHDMIITMTDLSRDGDTLGTIAKVPQIPENQFLHNQRIGKVKIYNHNLNEDFLYWLLHTDQYRNHVLETASGSTVKHTAPGRIRDFRFILPPPETQMKIAATLNSIHNKMELLASLRSVLIEMAETLYKHWFINTHSPASNVNEKEPSVQTQWEQQPLEAFGEIVCGLTPPKEKKEYFNGAIPFIKIPDMKNSIFITSTRDSLSQKGSQYLIKRQIPPEAICVSCIATVGEVGISTTWSHTNQQINTIIPDSHFFKYYLYFRLKSMKNELENLGSGGTSTLNISTGVFKKIMIPLPPIFRLKGFHKKVHPMFQRILLTIWEENHLNIMRDNLIRKLLNPFVSR